MEKSDPVPQAPRELLPEMDAFLGGFRECFGRRESWAALALYLTGLLLEHPNKNCETLAEALPDASEQQLQGLLTQMVWDEVDLN